jgi:hypothetical protein
MMRPARATDIPEMRIPETLSWALRPCGTTRINASATALIRRAGKE